MICEKIVNLFKPVPEPIFGSDKLPEDTPQKIAAAADPLIEDLDKLDLELRRHGIGLRRNSVQNN